MSGPNQVPVPSEHPNDDLLADLAAEVLAADLASQVQDHVIGCSRCAALLADAEGVRAMLLQIEPEQMPNEVLARLERAMLTAREADAAAGPEMDGGETRILGRVDGGETRVIGRVPPLGTDAGRADPGRRIARVGNSPAPETGLIAAVGSAAGPMAGGPKTSRLNRMSTTTQSARRQAIEEQKAEEPSRLAKLWPGLRIAAAVIVVAGAGAGALQLRGDAGSEESVSASTARDAAPVIAPVQSTKTDYTKKALRGQVETLIGASNQLLTEPQAQQSEEAAGGSVAANGGPSPGARTSESGAADSDAAKQAPLGEQGQLLRSPQALRACLTAIGAAQAEPVAVDLAKYAGREAAIIVLTADGGGYDVWAVARDCRPGNDGVIDVVNLKP